MVGKDREEGHKRGLPYPCLLERPDLYGIFGRACIPGEERSEQWLTIAPSQDPAGDFHCFTTFGIQQPSCVTGITMDV